MTEKKNIESKIKQALESLDDIGRVKAPDFFYTRLEAKMEAEMLGKPNSLLWLSNIRLSLIALGLLMVVNFASLITMEGNTDSDQSTIELLSDDYFSNDEGYQYMNNY